MAWTGYFQVDGNELINVARTEAYALNARLSWFRATYNNPALAPVLGDSSYTNPVTDDAPWYDTHIPVSAEFLGAYPLAVDGVENSTAVGTTIESLGNGGVVTQGRKATKTVVFSVGLVATSEAGAEYGLQWLKAALDGGGCDSDPSCAGYNLDYFASEPHIGSWNSVCRARVSAPLTADLAWSMFSRSLHKTRMSVGPVLTAKSKMSDGAHFWACSFTLVAGSPFEFSPTINLISGFMDPAVGNPWVGGTPVGGTYVSTPQTYPEPVCVPDSYVPVYDPLAPAVTPPPQPPGIIWGGVTPPSTWQRRRFTIPAQYIPAWNEIAPVFTINCPENEVRNLRLRIYEDLGATGDMPADTPCDWCADILVRYIPDSSVLVIDAANQLVYVENVGGARRRADSLVSSTSGDPFVWPALSCAVPYVVTVDLPSTETVPVLDMSLVGRSA